ncbi:MAG: hypothetical protein AAF846_01510 [Chloroflexota bacterium]
MKRIIYLLTFVLICTIGSSVSAQTSSAGCDALNLDSRDGQYTSGNSTVPQFFAGDIVSMTANPPIDAPSGGTPTQIRLEVNSVLVDTAPFPGTVTYTIPSDGNYDVFWTEGTTLINVTWSVECVDGMSSPPTPMPNPMVSVSNTSMPFCPIFTDGRINDCDTFNPVVLYGDLNDDGEWGLEVYSAEETGKIWEVSAQQR